MFISYRKKSQIFTTSFNLLWKKGLKLLQGVKLDFPICKNLYKIGKTKKGEKFSYLSITCQINKKLLCETTSLYFLGAPASSAGAPLIL